MCHRARFATGFRQPDIFGTAAIRNIVDAAPVFAPHRPHLFGAAFADTFVMRSRSKAHEPYFAFVNVAVAFAPPLPRPQTVPSKSKCTAVRGRRAEYLGGVAIRAD